ncbi:putative membrane protein YkoI [Altererythrobacter atlanticus]|uniref:Uncharacterized protein n=1 Tax=Croceibacterium atlanticum TaxID=1267766 RepID=A0A0F7KQT1_9SPHN|nr:hypothetical protein [Croceibacterium atlanticum]AKH41924.1 hypothetical protein WYH_00873 [Croceibacterium atlanticum]MBB5733510.1 putative membrane protein YkoI [Croceibacterium atlanticum]
MTKLIASIAAAALLAGGLAAPAAAQSRGDQKSAREEMKAGRTMSSSEIERRIVPRMKGDYLGFEYDGVASVYRLKFIRDGRVTWVDVDARTARVLRVSK